MKLISTPGQARQALVAAAATAALRSKIRPRKVAHAKVHATNNLIEARAATVLKTSSKAQPNIACLSCVGGRPSVPVCTDFAAPSVKCLPARGSTHGLACEQVPGAPAASANAALSRHGLAPALAWRALLTGLEQAHHPLTSVCLGAELSLRAAKKPQPGPHALLRCSLTWRSPARRALCASARSMWSPACA